MMRESWRLLDTGLASAARNIALNRALLEARHANESPSTLRFLRFSASALLGCRESPHEALDIGYCSTQPVQIQRRITGGTTWFVHERELGWELYLHRRETGTGGMDMLTKRTGHAAATALSALGMEARFRARDEIEVEGRTLCMLAHAAEGGGVLVQSVLLVDPDFARAARAVRHPQSRALESCTSISEDELARVTTAFASRFTGLKQILGRAVDVGVVKRNLAEAFENEFDVEFSEGDLNLSEHGRYLRALEETESAGWVNLVSRPASGAPVVETIYRHGAGELRVSLKYQTSGRTIRQVWFSGDVSLNPRRSLNDLEASLRDVPLDRLERHIQSFFASRAVDCGPLQPRDFVEAVRLAVGQRLIA
jgi:lipoate-protein ligase A